MSPSTVLDIRVTPRASRSTIVGWHSSPRIKSERASPTLLVKLAAPPVDGAANDALIEFLASVLDLPKRAIRIISGDRSRNKRIEVDGLSIDEIARRCNAATRNR